MAATSRAYKSVFLLAALSRVAPAADAPDSVFDPIQQSIRSGQMQQARSQIETALKTYPASAGLRNLEGIVEARNGNYLPAETCFRRAIELDPDLTPAYLNLGRLYQENAAKDKDAIRKAARVYAALLKRRPDNAEARYQGAYTMLLDRSYRSALTLAEGLPEDFQSRAQVLAVRCAAAAGLGAMDKADRLMRALMQSPDLTEDDVLVVQPVLARNNFRKMELSLLEALDGRRLATAASLARLSELYEEQQQLPEARRALEKAASQGPVTVPLLTRLAQIAWKQQDREGALGYLAHARELDPSNAGVHFFFGIVCVEMDLPLEAEKSLREAVSLNPENAWYNYALGAVTVQTRKWDAAIPYFQKYVRLRPEDPRGRLALAISRFESNDDDSARAELRNLTAYPATSATAHAYLGRLALRQDDLVAAEAELKASLKINPDNADTWAELANTYVLQKRFPPAKDALTRSLAVAPDGIRGNIVLLALYKQTGDAGVKDQSARVRQLAQKREEKAKALLRTIEVKPF